LLCLLGSEFGIRLDRDLGVVLAQRNIRDVNGARVHPQLMLQPENLRCAISLFSLYSSQSILHLLHLGVIDAQHCLQGDDAATVV
jgi:hypothetical protein